jgi:beta-carotene 3-hydroxylase
MEWLGPLSIVLATVVAMEGIAWASHKYVMHGFGWAWHRDHHEPQGRALEKNDRFALAGAALSIAMFAGGAARWWPGTWIGLGMLGYGAIYTLVHDGLVHQRWFRWVPKRGYARRLVQAHKLHHASSGKHGGVSFGFVFARRPAALRRELAAQRRAGRALLRPPAN